MKFIAICNVEYLHHTGVISAIRKGAVVSLELGRTETVHIKIGNDSVLKSIQAPVFNACFKRKYF